MRNPQEGSEELSEELQNPRAPSPPYSSLQDSRMVPSKGWADAQEGWGPGASSEAEAVSLEGVGSTGLSPDQCLGSPESMPHGGHPHLCTPGAQGFSRFPLTLRPRAFPAETPASLPPGVAITL